MRHDHAPDAELVAWRLRGEVEEGTRDVAGAVAEEKDGWEGVLVFVWWGGGGEGTDRS